MKMILLALLIAAVTALAIRFIAVRTASKPPKVPGNWYRVKRFGLKVWVRRKPRGKALERYRVQERTQVYIKL